jgi:hypothetical protein
MAVGSVDTLEIEVLINGDQISGLLCASIATTNCFSADTYSLTFAIGGDPLANIAFWSAIPSALIEVRVVTSSDFGSTYKSLITGMIDTIHVDPIRGTVGIEGRDLSSLMIDSYRQQDFVNQTASEIVSTVARYHGLRPITVPTTGNIGRYYSDGYTKLALGQFSRLQSDWDLLVQLARQNAFDVFVDGHSLYFQPSDEFSFDPLPVALQNVQSARIERCLNIPTDAAARVQSWSSQNMAAYDSDSSGEAAPTDRDSSSTNLSFLFSGSNYTPQQVSDAAERYAAELSRLGTVLSLDMPWDLTYSPRATCLLQGTASTFDTVYRIDSIDRHYSSTSGSRQRVRAVQI